MPVIDSEFAGNRWFKNKHAETILPMLLRNVDVNYIRVRKETPADDFFDTDWLKHPSNEQLVIIIHGLEGSSNANYVKGFARYFFEKGFDICAINFRSCSGVLNRHASSYHGGFYDDFHQLTHEILSCYKSVYPIGFSLGGNMLLHFLGAHANLVAANIKAAVTFSVPVDLANSERVLAKPDNYIYLYRFLHKLKHKIKQKAAIHPGRINIEDIDKIKNFEQFDEFYTAPLHGFSNAQHYYQSVSSVYTLHKIQIPTLLVNAQNDPFLGPSCYPYDVARQSDFFYLETPKFGGHVGFSYASPNGKYWSEQRAYEFLITQ